MVLVNVIKDLSIPKIITGIRTQRMSPMNSPQDQELPSEKFCVLIPTYNEENNIIPLVEKLIAIDCPLFVVDDGSTDKTATKLFLKEVPSFCLFPNKGKGFALHLGGQFLSNSGYEYILCMDADNQFKVEDIQKFDTALMFDDKTDIFIGNRFAGTTNMPKINRIANRVMSWVLSKLAGQKIEDSQCGFRMVRGEVFTELECKSTRFDYESEQLVLASWYGSKITSVPIDCTYSKDRKSNIHPIRDTYRFVKLVLWLSFRKMFKLF